jgi:transcriptional regulator with XRE-family HTH domain
MAQRSVGTPPETWGHLIKQRRKLLNMGQAELAEAAGITVVSLSRIENGNQTPRLKVMEAIARALRVGDMAELFPYPRIDRPVR